MSSVYNRPANKHHRRVASKGKKAKMISLGSLVLAVAVVALLYFLFKEEQIPGKLPPGPRGIPLIGSILSLSRKPHVRLGEWVKLYGSIFTLKIGPARFVVISDPKAAKEAFINPYLSGRPDYPLFNIQADGNHGITASEGPVWTEQRRFVMKTLRDFGFGKTTMQSMVLEEVKEFVQWLKSEQGNSLSLNRKFTVSTTNSLWSLMTSQRFPVNDPQLNQFLTDNAKLVNKLAGNLFVTFFPNLAKKLPGLSGWRDLMEFVRKSDEFVAGPIAEHKKSYDPADEPRDLVEAYLHEINKTTDSKSSFYKSEGEKNLQVTVFELFGAGSETTSITITWAILYLTKFRDIQDKVHLEIDSAVGRTRQPTLDDRKNMPYLEAVILEALRVSSIAPFGLFHSAMETTTLGDYTIPKGSWVAINIHHIHHDPSIWADPETFRPERFLTTDGKGVVKNDALMSFAVGRRACPGEQIAKDAIFMFLSAIFQRFDIKLDPSLPEPSLESATPFFLSPAPYYVIMKDRIE